MANPIMQALSARKTTSNIQEAVQRARQILSGGDNPLLASIVSLCRGQDPRDVFYRQCEQAGVDPAEILSMLK